MVEDRHVEEAGLVGAVDFLEEDRQVIGKQYFHPEHLKKIEDTVTEAERKTSVEIVPYIIQESDDYRVAFFRSAYLVSCLGLFTLSCLSYFFVIPSLHLQHYFFLYFLLFSSLGFSLSYLPSIKRHFLLSEEKNEEVSQKALETFYSIGLHRLGTQNGILIFISLTEKKVRILWDRAWNDLHPDCIPLFETYTKDLGVKLKNGQTPAEALSVMICDIGRLCEERFPQSEEQKRNFLSNTFIKK
jgi:putative membrane protein